MSFTIDTDSIKLGHVQLSFTEDDRVFVNGASATVKRLNGDHGAMAHLHENFELTDGALKAVLALLGPVVLAKIVSEQRWDKTDDDPKGSSLDPK